TRLKQRESIEAPARLLATLPGEPDSVLIQSYGYGIKGDYNAAYKMNVNSGLLTKVAMSPIRDGTFVLDAGHRVAFVFGEDLEGSDELFYRPTGTEQWKLVANGTPGHGFVFPVGAWSGTGDFLALDDRDASTTGVFSYAPETSAAKLLFRK